MTNSKQMRIERIEHEEADKATSGTKYTVEGLIDFQSCHDLTKELMRRPGITDEEIRQAYADYFSGLIQDMAYYDDEEADDETYLGKQYLSGYNIHKYELVIQYPAETDEYYSRLTGHFWETEAETIEDALEEMRAVDPDTFADLDENHREYWVERRD